MSKSLNLYFPPTMRRIRLNRSLVAAGMALLLLVPFAASVSGVLEGRLDAVITVEATDQEQIVVDVFPNGQAWNVGLREGDVYPVGRDLHGELSGNFAALGSPGIDAERLARENPMSLSQAAILWAVGLFMVGNGLAVWLRSRARDGASYYLSFVLMTGIALAVAPATSFGQAWALAVVAILMPIVGLTFLALFATFPVSRSHRRLVRLSIGTQLSLAALVWIAYAVSVVGPSEAYVIAQRLGLLALVFPFILGMGMAIKTLVRPPDARVGEQMRIIAVGVTAAVLPFTLLSITPSLVGVSEFVPRSRPFCRWVSCPWP